MRFKRLKRTYDSMNICSVDVIEYGQNEQGKIDFCEESAGGPVALHVAYAVNVHEERNHRDHHEHHDRKRVNQKADVCDKVFSKA